MRMIREKKRIEFIDEVNQILERNNLAYKLSNQGTFERIITEDFRAILDVDVDNIETEVNKYISDAKMKIKSCDKEKRVEAIEILWKAFERLKSLYVSQGIDKRKSVEMLVEKTMNEQPVLFNLVNNVLMKDFLTKAGNDLRIRHHETDKENLHEDNQIDLLFQIMLVTLNYLINSQERF